LANTVGIPTKWAPTMEERAFFRDEDFSFVRPLIHGIIVSLYQYRRNGYNVWLPLDGIGTGLARLPQKAPLIYNYIKSELEMI
jgi:hypothetical protein